MNFKTFFPKQDDASVNDAKGSAGSLPIKQEAHSADKFDLETSLFRFSDEPGSPAFTQGDSYTGIACFGATGSGKTSGSARMIAHKLLHAGYGGCVLTVKNSDVKDWQQYCADTGRTDDLIIVEPGPGSRHAFDFMHYESTRNTGLSYVDDLYQVLKTVIEASQDDQGGRGSDDFFWQAALEGYILNLLTLCMLGYKKVTVPMLRDISVSAPRSRQDGKPVTNVSGTAFQMAVKAAKTHVEKQIEALRQEVDPPLLSRLSGDDLDYLYSESLPDYRSLNMLNQYFMHDLYNIGSKTRSIIDFSFSGFLNRLLREPLYSLFCSRPSTFTPDDCLQGKITLINLPVKVYQKAGQTCQILYKYIWQRAMERRNIEENGRGLFLFADEAQFFVHPMDTEFQATARSSRISTVYITQSLNSYYAAMGGDKADYKVKTFLDSLATKFFHANSSVETNEWASALIGSGYSENLSRTTQMSGDFNISNSSSYNLERMVRPEEFALLKNGGPQNQYQVHAYIHMQAKRLKNGMNFQKISINQKTKF